MDERPTCAEGSCVIKEQRSGLLSRMLGAWRSVSRTGTQLWGRRGLVRSFSGTHGLVTVSTEPLGPYTIAHLSINRPPVNSFDVTLVSDFTATFKELANSREVQAVVVKSSLPTVFSAGIDFKELCGASQDDLRQLWAVIRDMWFQLYSSRVTTLAAISGHCLAGGTLIAAACDHRIAAQGDFKIGVSAAKLGLVPPHWFLKNLAHLMGQRATEHHLQQGRVFPPDQALEVGLVDEVCEPGDMEERCREALQSYLDVCHDSRAEIKLSLRRDVIESFHQLEEEDVENFVRFTLRESTQKRLASMLAK